MAAGMPELGSKISLISKADIRYEGRLFTVDPQECTIALSSVRSFGTEDRDTQYVVPAQSQVYDYILFRGRDIKDIRVVNSTAPHPQPLNDPAIMQLSVPPTLGTQQYQHPLLGHVAHNPYGSFISMGGLAANQGAAPGLQQAGGTDLSGKPGVGVGGGGVDMSAAAGGSGKPSELIMSATRAGGTPGDIGVVPPHSTTSVLSSPPLPPPAVGEPTRPKDRSGSVLDLIGGGSNAATATAAGGGAVSRSTTPASIGSRKSVSVDQGTQAGASQRDNRRHVRPIQPPRNYQQQQQSYYQQGNNRSRERRNSQNNQDYRPQYSQQQQQHHQQQNRGPRPQYRVDNNQGGSGNYNNGAVGGGNYNQRSGGWGNQKNGGMQRGRGRLRGGPFRPGVSGQMGNRRTTLKFENDYDFEQANTEFEELKNKLSKVKLDEASGSGGGGGGGASSSKSDGNNDANGATAVAGASGSGSASGGADGGSELDKKDDSGNETGAGDTEQEEDHEIYYDKTKSFFDQISCEAAERAKGKLQRTDWRKERKLNSETFGIAATRRGNYRGRPGYRGGYRGGYRIGNYRQSNQTQRRNNEQQNSQQGNKKDVVYLPLSHAEALAKSVSKQDELRMTSQSNTENS